jgi:hypothetical protein
MGSRFKEGLEELGKVPFDQVTEQPTNVLEKRWRPLPKQAKFLAIPDTVFEGFFAGSKGPGKTDTLVLFDVVRGFTEHPKFKSLMLRRNFPDLDAEIVVRQREWYAPAGASYNESKRRWTWPSGAISQNGHADKENDVRKYDTAEYNLLKWDEATHFLPFQYQYLTFTRCRSASPDLPAICRLGSNPGNVGHTYFRKRFVDPYRPGNKILKDARTGLKRIYIPAGPYDNPILLKNDPTYLMKLESLPLAERKAAFGDWYTFSGQVFEEWRLEPLDGEPLNARHVCESFPIPFWWPRILAIDWGFAALTVAGWGAVSPDGRVYIYRVYAAKGRQIKDWAVDVCNLSSGENITLARICHSANQNRGEPLTILEQVNNALAENGLDIGLELAERDRLGGKMITHEYLRWLQKPKIKPNEGFDQKVADKIMRQQGEAKLLEYLNFFVEQPDETNLPKLQIFDIDPEGTKAELSNLCECIANCIYDEKDVDGKPAEDVREFDGDDYYDMIRMLLRAVSDYVVGAADEFERRKRIDAVYQHLEKTGDQTRFYRVMENFESTISGRFRAKPHSRLKVPHRRIR